MDRRAVRALEDAGAAVAAAARPHSDSSCTSVQALPAALSSRWAATIDLTCEFPEGSIRNTSNYLLTPCWDGVPPTPVRHLRDTHRDLSLRRRPSAPVAPSSLAAPCTARRRSRRRRGWRRERAARPSRGAAAPERDAPHDMSETRPAGEGDVMVHCAHGCVASPRPPSPSPRRDASLQRGALQGLSRGPRHVRDMSATCPPQARPIHHGDARRAACGLFSEVSRACPGGV